MRNTKCSQQLSCHANVLVYTQTKSYMKVGRQGEGGGRRKGEPHNTHGELKVFKTFRLTPTAVNHLDKLAKLNNYDSRTAVLEELARPDGDFVAVPRHVIEWWMNESSKVSTSPRWQRAKELLTDLEEYLPTRDNS